MGVWPCCVESWEYSSLKANLKSVHISLYTLLVLLEGSYCTVTYSSIQIPIPFLDSDSPSTLNIGQDVTCRWRLHSSTKIARSSSVIRSTISCCCPKRRSVEREIVCQRGVTKRKRWRQKKMCGLDRSARPWTGAKNVSCLLIAP